MKRNKIIFIIGILIVLGIILFFYRSRVVKNQSSDINTENSEEQLFDDYPADDTDSGSIPQ